MASIWTRVSRSCTNTQIRVAVGLAVLSVIYLLYRRHSAFTPGKSKGDQTNDDKNSVASDKQSFNGEIYLPDQQEHARVKQNRYDDEGDYDNKGLDEKDHKNEAALDDLYEFQSDLLNLEMQEVPAYMLQEGKCPACYGDDLCEEIKLGKIKINIPETSTKESNKGVYFGRWYTSGNFIVLKQQAYDTEYQKFDNHICKSIGHNEDCDVSKAITESRSPVMQTEAFLPANLQKAKKITALPQSTLSYAYCGTKNLISGLSEAFDSNADGKLNAKDIATFYFSSVINPESVILQFLGDLKIPLPIPHYWGACGRVIIEEAVGKTLDKFLQSDWSLRADFGLQMLDLIDVLINGDPEWGVIFADFHLENFAVNEDGQLYIIDVDGMALIEKSQQVKPDSQKPCNWDCLQHYGRSMMTQDQSTFCPQALHVGSEMMYFFACQLLSDKVSHKVVYNDQPNVLEKADPGLLHDPPASSSEDLYGLLGECITETSVGGRRQAVDELKEMLEEWVYNEEEEDEEDSEGEDPGEGGVPRGGGDRGDQRVMEQYADDNARYQEDEEEDDGNL